MEILRRTFVAVMTTSCALAPVAAWAQAPIEVPVQSARTWLDQAAEIEEFIRRSEVSNIEDIGTGVTNPKRADLEPGGPVDQIVFKPLRPGIYRGYWESYLSEVAAYELDKLLNLGMTPPTVEKRVRGDLGAAVMWVEPTQTFKDLGGPPTPPSTHIGRFNWELIRAKMFHNLIYNRDPNLGNWLVDPAWNLVLIDNSRAFTPDDKMVHKLTRVDRDLWARFVALDAATLSTALGEWLDDDEVRGILKRRDLMAEEIEEMVEARGELSVFVRFVPIPPAPTPTAAVDKTRGQALGGQLVDAVTEAPVVLPGSELTWIGRIVRLADYDGPQRSIAAAGADAGHMLGIVTELDGLLCLTRDLDNPEHYDRLIDLPGQTVEVFGIISETAGLPLVEVTLSRRIL